MQRRTNQEWVEELRGRRGPTPQSLAYQDLGAYMYRVAYNHLLYRQAQANPRILKSFAPQELATLAEDFVQETQEKLVINDFALLDKFTGKGAFTSWMAKVVKNEVGQELRKSYWNRWVSLLPEGSEQDEERSSAFELIVASPEASPENARMQEEVRQVLKGCLEGLNENQRLALLGLVVEGLSGKELAGILNSPSRNAVFLLARRAKRNMRKCLEEKRWAREDFDVFSQ
ncbi:MAG: RNA polymerase sigma factor [Ardenticatenaceae bacterium]